MEWNGIRTTSAGEEHYSLIPHPKPDQLAAGWLCARLLRLHPSLLRHRPKHDHLVVLEWIPFEGPSPAPARLFDARRTGSGTVGLNHRKRSCTVQPAVPQLWRMERGRDVLVQGLVRLLRRVELRSVPYVSRPNRAQYSRFKQAHREDIFLCIPCSRAF